MQTPKLETLEAVRQSRLADEAVDASKALDKLHRAELQKQEYEKWLADAPTREAEQKALRDKAAMAAEVARKAKRAAVRESIRDDFPGLPKERRATINNEVLSNPTRNYIFAGPGGVGKTTLLSALAQLASIDGKQVLWTTGVQWESALRRDAYADFEDKQVLELSAEGLENCRPLLICFDEVDKIGNTKFILDNFHNLIDVAIAAGHQVIVTTNLNQSEFKDMLSESLSWRFFFSKDKHGRGGLGAVWVPFEETA